MTVARAELRVVSAMSIVFAGLSVMWACGSIVVFAVTGDGETVGNWLASLAGDSRILFWLFFLGQFTIVPCGLLLGLKEARRRMQTDARFGALTGLAVGLWSSSVLVGVPACGVYPNLISTTILLLAFWGRLTDPGFYMAAIGINLILWPLVGRMAFPKFAARRANAAAAGNVRDDDNL